MSNCLRFFMSVDSAGAADVTFYKLLSSYTWFIIINMVKAPALLQNLVKYLKIKDGYCDPNLSSVTFVCKYSKASYGKSKPNLFI